jgi:hypothetical protein
MAKGQFFVACATKKFGAPQIAFRALIFMIFA